MPCTHLKELVTDEGPFLEIELQKHQVLLENKLGKHVSRTEVQIDYLTKLGQSYLTGFKDCYCAYVCLDRETCEIPKKKNDSIIPR